MNTPSSKEPKRYKRKERSQSDRQLQGTIENAEIAMALGRLIAKWTHVEEEMSTLFGDILEIPDDGVSRIVFRSMIAQTAREKVMLAVLRGSPQHVNVSGKVDAIIAEFMKLNGIRNRYVHGLWWSSGPQVFLEEKTDTYDGFGNEREVLLSELEGTTKQMDELLVQLFLMTQTRELRAADKPKS